MTMAGVRRKVQYLTVIPLTLAAAVAFGQTELDPDSVVELRNRYFEDLPQPPVSILSRRTVKACDVAPLSDEVVILGETDGGGRGTVDLYNGLLPSGNGFWFWTLGGSEAVYWVLDDGAMSAAATPVGGGHVTELEFSFGLHADGDGDTLRPYVVVSFYSAPPDPVADATNPAVNPPAPVISLAFNFNPITLPTAGFYAFRSGLVDLAAAGLDFDLDETYYVEILPMEWSSYPNGSPIFDPDVFAVFTGPGTVTSGSNQDQMWSDLWTLQTGCDPVLHRVDGNGNGYYEHPAEIYDGGCSPNLNQSGIILRGTLCEDLNVLELGINEPNDICVQPGEPVTVTLSQSCLPELVSGYQAFLSFDPAALTFESGSYIGPLPYGLPIITPIATDDGEINISAGIDNQNGQVPTSSGADLVTLSFTAGAAEGPTLIVFRAHDPATRFSDEYGIEVSPTLLDSPLICVDGTPPTLICPPDRDLQCIAEIPTAASNLAEFIAQGGTADDPGGCGYELTLTHESDIDNGGNGCPDDPYIVERSYRLTDCSGNTSDCMQTITVIDDTPPTIAGCPSTITVSNDAGFCSAVVSWTEPIATDNCNGAVTIVSTHTPGQTLPVGTTTVTYTATDVCGNYSECVFDVIVNDDEDPGISCPADITINADAGGCTAYVTVPVPVTNDNCAIASLVNDFNSTGDASGTYPCGATTVLWAVTDIHGNTNTCTHTITVNAFNELLVDIELSPTIVAGPITRCITFELWQCPGTSPTAIVSQAISFTNGLATGVLVPVPSGVYDCVTARDELHTLRRTDEDHFGITPIIGTQYVADFTDQSAFGGDNDALIGGNLNDDEWIDVLDWGVFSSVWGTTYPAGGNTDCSTPPPHADINGDGFVATGDFTFIQINFLNSHEADCCNLLNFSGGDDPVMEISIDQLEQMGLGAYSAGDLNHDGRLDQADIVEFLNGARPRPHTIMEKPEPRQLKSTKSVPLQP